MATILLHFANFPARDIFDRAQHIGDHLGSTITDLWYGLRAIGAQLLVFMALEKLLDMPTSFWTHTSLLAIEHRAASDWSRDDGLPTITHKILI